MEAVWKGSLFYVAPASSRQDGGGTIRVTSLNRPQIITHRFQRSPVYFSSFRYSLTGRGDKYSFRGIQLVEKMLGQRSHIRTPLAKQWYLQSG